MARRRFLEQASSFALGAVSLTILPLSSSGEGLVEAAPGPAPGSNSPGSNNMPESKKSPVYGFLVDTEKCIGAGKCLSACRVENQVPDGYSRTWVERYIHFKDGTIQVDLLPETGFAGGNDSGDSGPNSHGPNSHGPIDLEQVERAYFVPKLCNHCDAAPCNQVCPVHASITSPEGFELVDAERCIGCGYCVQACPYGTRFINPTTGTADKCTWCYHRVKRQEQPACVEACPVGARLFGRLDDPESAISQRLRQIPTSVLKAHLGTHPKTKYLGIGSDVI